MPTRNLYVSVNATWPDTLPPLSAQEAVSAAKRLYRFAFKRAWAGEIVVTSGRRYSRILRGTLYVNPTRGWHAFVHELSHTFFYRLHPKFAGHDSRHAYLEKTLVSMVVEKGWLDGKLKLPEKPKVEVDLQATRYAKVKAALDRAQHRKMLAEAAIKRLKPRVRYYEKQFEEKAA